jgi:hypothetical protein
VDAPVHVVGAAGHAQDLLAAVAGFGPHRAALACAMHDPMRHTAQRYDSAGLKGCGLRQTAKTGGDPATVKLRKVLGFHERAPRRHGQDGLAIGWMNAQGVTPRAAVPPQPDRKDLRSVLDQKRRGFGGPPIKEGASSHVLESGE